MTRNGNNFDFFFQWNTMLGESPVMQTWGFERVILLGITKDYPENGTRGVIVEGMVQFAKLAITQVKNRS